MLPFGPAAPVKRTIRIREVAAKVSIPPFTSRPTRSVIYPKLPTFGYKLPLEIKFTSGYKEQCWAVAFPEGVGMCGIHISKQLLARAGGAKRCHGKKWPDPWGPSGFLVPADLTILHGEDKLLSSTLAEVDEHWSLDADIVVHPDVIDSLADCISNSEVMVLRYPKVAMFVRWTLDQLLHSAVLILGPDTGKQLRLLRFVEVRVNQLGMRGWLLKDYHDFAGRDLHQKLFSMASASSFILMLDSVPSGHLLEIQALSVLQSQIAILRASGSSGSWMLDPVLARPNVRLFEYKATADDQGLFHAIVSAVNWARESIHRKATALDLRYPWRSAEIDLAQIVFPTRGTPIENKLVKKHKPKSKE